MKCVYLITHFNPLNADIKHVGVFISRENADLCVRRMIEQPGFSKHPKNFRIYKYQVNQEKCTQEIFSLQTIKKLPLIPYVRKAKYKDYQKIGIVWHIDRADEYNDRSTILGFYSSLVEARKAAQKLRETAQYKNYPREIKAFTRALEDDWWFDGYKPWWDDEDEDEK